MKDTSVTKNILGIKIWKNCAQISYFVSVEYKVLTNFGMKSTKHVTVPLTMLIHLVKLNYT